MKVIDEMIVERYKYAKEIYGALGVDVDEAIARVDEIPISMHCWQGKNT